MLWSAYYPCRYLRLSSHFWTRQCPRFFRFPVRSIKVGLDGRLSTSFFRCFFACANRLSLRSSWSDCLSARRLESTQSSGWVSSGLLIPLFAVWSTNAFQFSLGQTGPPDLTASGPIPRCLTTRDAHNILRQVSGFVSLRHLRNLLRRLFSSQLLIGPPARLVFLGRDTATCFRLQAPLSMRNQLLPETEDCLGCDSTLGSYASRCGRTLAHFQLPDVSAVASGSFCGLPRLPTRSHVSLFIFSAPGPAFGPSLFPQLRLCDVLWSARYPSPTLLFRSSE